MFSSREFSGNGETGREELNQGAVDITERRAEAARHIFIDYSNKAVNLFNEHDVEVLEQLELQNLPKGESVGLYVLEDIIHALATDEEVPSTKTILLIPALDDYAPSLDEEKMRLFVPLDESGELPDVSNPPAEVYVEKTDKEGNTRRYIISESGMFEYISAADTGQQEIMDDLHPEILSERLYKRIDTGLPTIDSLTEDLINMRAVAQRVITVGSGRPLDY